MSQIMDQLASEEDANLESDDKMNVSTSILWDSASPSEAPSTALLSPPSMEVGEAPRLPVLSQYNNARELRTISMAADSPRISSANATPPPEPFLRQPSDPNTRSWRTRIRAWSAKLHGSVKR